MPIHLRPGSQSAGEPSFLCVVAALRPLVSRVILVGGTDRFVPWTANDPSLAWIADTVAGLGPLAGMVSGLAACQSPWCYVLSCDTPYVTMEVLALLGSAAGGGVDAIVPRLRGGAEPLLALYARHAHAALANALALEQRAVHRALEHLRVRWIEEADLRCVDPHLRSFTNLNRPEDLTLPG